MKSIIFLLFVTSLSVHANPKTLTLTVIKANNVNVVASTRFIATRDNFLCKNLVVDMGNFKRIPKTKTVEQTLEKKILKISDTVSGYCKYKRVSGTNLAISKNGTEAANVVDVHVGGGTDKTQGITCNTLNYGPAGKEVPSTLCHDDGIIRTTDKGNANLKIVFN